MSTNPRRDERAVARWSRRVHVASAGDSLGHTRSNPAKRPASDERGAGSGVLARSGSTPSRRRHLLTLLCD